MLAMRARAVTALLLLSLAASACGNKVELGTAAKIVDVTTGWFDAGVTEDGKNKLVPSISFRLQNTASQELHSTQLNLIFKRVTDKDEWTTSYVRGIGQEGLQAGATTEPIVVRAQQGYTGVQPRLTMLQNKEFVDFKVEIFGKQGSAAYVKLGEFPIERQLLTH